MVTTTTATITEKTLTAKSAVKDVVDTMGENLYDRFISAFQEENETQTNEKRPPLVSDEQLEDTFKTLKKSITQGIEDLKSPNDQNEAKKTSRFQRWIIHYLKAPFQKWESKKVNSNIEQKQSENESEKVKEEQIISSLDTDDDDDDDDESSESDDDDDELEEQTTAETVENLNEKVCLIIKIL